jgi:hypothetical protein
VGALPSGLTLRPLFLLSLPRSGSTLVQRVIAGHERVATTSEPWLLLPLLYSLREEGARAEYWHEAAAQAIQDFSDTLPDGRSSYLGEAREMALRLYERAAGEGAAYFLDKTPHYHLIADELLDLFPDAKFVFLWRNPLAVVSSLLDTFRRGRWEPWLFSVDIFDGVENLTAAHAIAGDRTCAIRYEDLVRGETEWGRLFEYLDLDFDPRYLRSFHEVELSGRYGDPSGVTRYAELSQESLARWHRATGSPIRKAWCRRYLCRIGKERLGAMGYELEALLAELGEIPSRPWRAPLDCVHLTSSRLVAARLAHRLRGPDSPRPLGAEWGAGRLARIKAVALRTASRTGLSRR